jgi:predicted aspartyl protease
MKTKLARSALSKSVRTLVLFLMPLLVPSLAAQTIPVSFTRTGASVVVDVAIGGKTRHFLLDTGAGLTVLSPDTAGWSPVDLLKSVSNRLAVGIDGTTHSMGSTTAALEFAQTTVVTPAAVADLAGLSKALHIKLDGILGQDVLSHFSRVTIDYKNKQLILEK